MRIIIHNEWRMRAIFAAVIIMLASLFVSRALLSISIVLFVALTTIHAHILPQLRSFLRSPLLVATSFLFLIPFISGGWSSNSQTWLNISLIKLPFLLLPVAFAGQWKLKDREWTSIAYCFLLFAFIGCCWSIWQYLQDMEGMNKSYLRAKTIPTPLGHDHVRFSWIVAIAVVCCGLLIRTLKKRKIQWLLGILMFLLIAYLHVLSARTGLVAVYFFLLCFAVFIARRSKKLLMVFIPSVIVLVLASWWFVPTLQNRVKYVIYDFSFVKNATVAPGTSDANRVNSWKGGYHILQQHPFGVGAGDIRNEMDKWYVANLPGIREQDKLFPSSEWIVHGDMAGWPAILLFTIIVAVPFFEKSLRHRFFWIMLISILVGGCVIETSLEIQFGIFIYCFTILWWWKWLKIQNK